MSNAIPTKSRQAVKAREMDRCARCAGKGSEWHHRRSRSIRDNHTHCTCNGVWLCGTCHRWVHAHPFEARAIGMIVSRYRNPSEMQVQHLLYGWVRLNCEGHYTTAQSYEMEAASEE